MFKRTVSSRNSIKISNDRKKNFFYRFSILMNQKRKRNEGLTFLFRLTERVLHKYPRVRSDLYKKASAPIEFMTKTMKIVFISAFLILLVFHRSAKANVYSFDHFYESKNPQYNLRELFEMLVGKRTIDSSMIWSSVRFDCQSIVNTSKDNKVNRVLILVIHHYSNYLIVLSLDDVLLRQSFWSWIHNECFV